MALLINGLNEEQTRRWLDGLRQRESSGKNVDNAYGYTGQFQFGSGALKEIGFLKPNAPTSGKYQQKILNNPDNWTIPGGKEAFLNSTALQEQAAVALANKNLQALGKAAPTDPVARAGALAASHLVGAGAARNYLLGKSDKKDGNGVTASTYFNLANQWLTGKTPPAGASAQQAQARPRTSLFQPPPTQQQPIQQQNPTLQPQMQSPIQTPAPQQTGPSFNDYLTNLSNTNAVDIATMGIPKSNYDTLQTSIGTLHPETQDEKSIINELNRLPPHLRDIAAENYAKLATADVMNPTDYTKVYSDQMQEGFKNLIKGTGALDG